MRVANDDARFREILREHWGYRDFRGIQLDIIRSIAAGHDTLGLMPTGGGKSVTFQVPALAAEGMSIVVTPLIALMKDQVNHLLRRGIRAAAVYSGLSRDDIQLHLDNCIYGGNKFLYVSPERLSSELFQQKLARMKVSFITVDEAHCISQWGYDFRPAYLEIAKLRDLLPGVPVLALTATATPRVAEDICRQLRFRDNGRSFRMSFERKNLSYVVRRAEDKEAELLHILRSVPGSAIVYTRSRQGAKDTARLLEAEGIGALYYHAGLTNVDKDVRQQAWQDGGTRVIVATNAFGMGIDKADVRLVVHMDVPDSMEAYFQEAGRAGRDGRRAYAVLLTNGNDRRKLTQRIPDTFPDKDYVRRVYECLSYYFELPMGGGEGRRFEFDLDKFCRVFKFFPVPALSASELLTRGGYINYHDSEESTSRILFLVARDELYSLNYLTPLEVAVVQGILRNYGGIFSDYVYIHEATVADTAGTDTRQVYEVLKGLTRQRILHYIPRKSTPYVSYPLRRIPQEDVEIGPDIYEDRLEEYKERIRAMVDYTEEEDECRSHYLLRYFGEQREESCGQCDVCLSRKPRGTTLQEAERLLLAILADGQPHAPADLRLDGLSTETAAQDLQHLVAEGEVVRTEDAYPLARPAL